MIHSKECEVRVTERVLYPHKAGEIANRTFTIPKGRRLSNFTAMRGNVLVVPREVNLSGTRMRFELETERSVEPVLFTLSYNLVNGLESICGWPMLTWSGQHQRMVDVFHGRLVSTSTEIFPAKLLFQKEIFRSPREHIVEAQAVNSPIEVSAALVSRAACAVSIPCPKGLTGWRLLLVRIGGVCALIVVLFCFCALVIYIVNLLGVRDSDFFTGEPRRTPC